MEICLKYEKLSQVIDEMIKNRIDFKLAIQEVEAMYIQKVLEKNGGNISITSEMMGLHRNTLSRKMKQLSVKKMNGRQE